jgi:hypothetical protein
MRPSPAELARTLVAGRLAGTVQVACRPGPLAVDYATDGAGRPLLLTRVGTAVAESLRPRDDDADDVAVVLSVDDVAPISGAPTVGRVHVSGWVAPLTGTDALAAAEEFAEVNPVGDLLDLGRGTVLHRVEPAEIRLTRGNGTPAVVALDDFLAADPDPLRRVEAELLADLEDHHGEQVDAFVASVLACDGVTGAAAGRVAMATDGAPARIVRLDRYGMVVARGPGRFLRLQFTRPVRDAADLADLLHPVLFPRCDRHATR